MSLWKEKDQPHRQFKMDHWRFLEQPSIRSSTIPVEGSPSCPGQAGFPLSGCGEQACIEVIRWTAVEVAGLPAAHLGRVRHVSESSHTRWAQCPGTAQCSLPALWFLIEYDLFTAFQGLNSLMSGAPFPILPLRAWVKRIIGSERNLTACHTRQYQKFPL